jgi:zinc/manganese transport system substrate-binding protein
VCGLRAWASGVSGAGGRASIVTLSLAALLLAGCGSTATVAAGAGPLRVVASENFWGSIASQLGGARVRVTSIVNNPDTDPHAYESSVEDARAAATAQYVIINGAGYDTWARKLLDANPVMGRHVLTVADLLGKRAGDNPHFWYSPDYVARVADRITADYQALDPADAGYFAQRRAAFTAALAPYHARMAAIKAAFAGQPIGATESIFVYMAGALGLNLISPPAFMRAVSQGNDPPAGVVAEFQQQIEQGQIRVLIYNAQTQTVITSNLLTLAAARHIPTIGITETMQPPAATFQDWQDAQLRALQQALTEGERAGEPGARAEAEARP